MRRSSLDEPPHFLIVRRGAADTGVDTGVVVLKLARIMQRSQGLPPVSLYKITGAHFAHFVLDSNHRVSVETLHQWSRRKP
jgi:hypothetical protein